MRAGGKDFHQLSESRARLKHPRWQQFDVEPNEGELEEHTHLAFISVWGLSRGAEVVNEGGWSVHCASEGGLSGPGARVLSGGQSG